MPSSFFLAQFGTTLNAIQPDGTVAVLSLPSNITLINDIDRRPRFSQLGRYTFMVNSPTRNVFIDGNRVVRPMCLQPPSFAPILSAVGAGTLNGAFKVKVSFAIVDTDTGEILVESPLGPASVTSAALVNQILRANGIPRSAESLVNLRRLYRTTTGPGNEYFHWADVEDNTIDDFRDGLSDTQLQIDSAPTDLGNAPGTVGSSRAVLVAEFKGRLFMVPYNQPDHVLFSSPSPRFYAWDPDNDLLIAPEGKDQRGVIGFAPLRDEIGCGKVDSFHKIVAQSSTFRPIQISENVGIEAPESVVIIRNIAYFLWKDGLYEYSANGIRCLSDGKVRKWFTSATYFNTARFKYACGRYNPVDNSYECFLSAAGSTDLDRWFKYRISDQTFWGPHKTSKFIPTCTTSFGQPVFDANDNFIHVVGTSDGFVYKDNPGVYNDGATDAIDFDVDTKFHDCDSPTIEKFFGMMEVISKIQAAGTLTITPYPGGLDAAAGTTLSADMTKDRQKLDRVLEAGKTGRMVKLNFRHTTINQGVEIYGYEIPSHELGER